MLGSPLSNGFLFKSAFYVVVLKVQRTNDTQIIVLFQGKVLRSYKLGRKLWRSEPLLLKLFCTKQQTVRRLNYKVYFQHVLDKLLCFS